MTNTRGEDRSSKASDSLCDAELSYDQRVSNVVILSPISNDVRVQRRLRLFKLVLAIASLRPCDVNYLTPPSWALAT